MYYNAADLLLTLYLVLLVTVHNVRAKRPYDAPRSLWKQQLKFQFGDRLAYRCAPIGVLRSRSGRLCSLKVGLRMSNSMTLKTQRRKFAFRLPADLVAYLNDRAARNFRDASGELAAILAALQQQDADLSPASPGATVTPLFGSRGDVPQRGPLGTQSGYKGVYVYGKRWSANVHVDGRQKRLGAYDTPQEAARAYDDYVRETGGYGAVNFPRPGETGVGDNTDTDDLDAETWDKIRNGPAQATPLSFEDPPTFDPLPPGIVRRPTEDPDR